MTALDTQVLIVGAGPTGLTLALWLTKLGVAVRVIDKSTGPGETSRALAVQARTLEFDRQIGIVDDVIDAGVKLNQLTLHGRHRIAARLKLSAFGEGLSRYSFAFALPQDVHEKILVAHLEEAGVRIERRTELVSFEETDGGVTVTTEKDGVKDIFRVDYLCGCDGARSTVRHNLHIGFPGGTYAQSFYVADVQGDGEVTRNGMDVSVGSYGFAIVMPVRQSGSLRLIGVVPQEHEQDETITFESIRKEIERDTRISVRTVNWFSTYHVHHRVAERFRVGRVFLAGDAGHIHSPAGGQGMNTGIGDAVNLAWKLAAVIQGRADPILLDSYEQERIGFAHVLIKNTDQVFRVAASANWFIRMFRRFVMPKIMQAMSNTRRGSRTFFRLISQIGIRYPGSPLSAGAAGEVKGGDRLPYVPYGAGDNHAPLTFIDWQVHVYGAANLDFLQAMARAGIAVHVFAWSEAVRAAGLAEHAAYLVRPDGHVALAGSQQAEAFRAYLDRFAIKPRRPQTQVPGTARVRQIEPRRPVILTEGAA